MSRNPRETLEFINDLGNRSRISDVDSSRLLAEHWCNEQ
jgi:hypothetical protein